MASRKRITWAMKSSSPNGRAGGDVAGVVPIGDVHVVLRQHGAHGAAQQGGEVAGHGGDQHDLGWLAGASFRKRSKVANGVRSATSSRTATSPPPALIRSIP